MSEQQPHADSAGNAAERLIDHTGAFVPRRVMRARREAEEAALQAAIAGELFTDSRSRFGAQSPFSLDDLGEVSADAEPEPAVSSARGALADATETYPLNRPTWGINDKDTT